MSIFNVLTLLGGLAMFLYGMRIMGDGLQEGSSGTLKNVMEKVTNNPVKALLLGTAITALIQSSTATIVITSGLVGAGIITLRQSLGIVIGANIGTTVTGQIIRLLDIDSSAAGYLQFFKPSTLAPIALIIGIVLIMGASKNNAKVIGEIAIGFGILFVGLLSMTDAVNDLAEMGVFEGLFSKLSDNPIVGYAIGATVAFILQSSSATIGILQAFSSSGQLHFNAIYAVIVGVYLGDCVTTAIVCWIGSKAEPRRVGMFNILFNLCKSALVLAVVTIIRHLGLLDWIWDSVVNSGIIANTNTIFNIACAIVLFPFITGLESLAKKIVKDDPVSENKYKERVDALSPAFFNTPALALKNCYDVLMTMFTLAKTNIDLAIGIMHNYDPAVFKAIQDEEENIDYLADHVGDYLMELSPHLSADAHVQIMDQYYKLVMEFERLGDHAMNIGESARELVVKNIHPSDAAFRELDVLEEVINTILEYTERAFEKRDVAAARMIEPLEQVVDDLVYVMKGNHLSRLRQGMCSVDAGAIYMNALGDIERISDVCSNVGVSVVMRVSAEDHPQAHDYISVLHSGKDEEFNREYNEAHQKYFGMLRANDVKVPEREMTTENAELIAAAAEFN